MNPRLGVFVILDLWDQNSCNFRIAAIRIKMDGTCDACCYCLCWACLHPEVHLDGVYRTAIHV